MLKRQRRSSAISRFSVIVVVVVLYRSEWMSYELIKSSNLMKCIVLLVSDS